MYMKMFKNYIRKNKLVSAATCTFMAISAAFIGLTVLLSVSLLGSIDNLMTEAKTCDFLQMHSGDIDPRQLTEFAKSRSDVEDMLIANFLNIENSRITLNGISLADSTQDNGLCIQNENFDHLLGTENEILHASEGTVYVPVCYKSEYDLEPGQEMRIGDLSLTIAGFLRDSQMNSMMASSKRFLVSSEDYRKLESIGRQEYLIEFLIKDGFDIDAFATAYADAGLPANGPTITSSLIKMMNALSDGMMILIIFLAGIVVLVISLICIRYIVLTGMEKDKKSAGMLKALGLSGKNIRKIFISKYVILSLSGGIIGALATLVISKPLGMQMRELYGASGDNAGTFEASLIGILVTESIILLSIRKHLKKNDLLSAVEVISDRSRNTKRRKDSLIWITAVAAAAVFLILVPVNFSTTISSERFVSYMGVGQSHVRMDVRQGDDIAEISNALEKQLSRELTVGKYVLMQTKSFRATLPGNQTVNLTTEIGDHTIFPLNYLEGDCPKAEGEIALSKLNSEELGCNVGDTIVLHRSSGDVTYTVCGIYSDITNGGKTAKIYGDSEFDKDVPIMWSIIYVSLNDPNGIESFIKGYQEFCEEYGSSVKITDIAGYMDGLYGRTIKSIGYAAALSFAVSCIIIFIVVVLFIRLMIWQEKSEISLKKALGIKVSYIRNEYAKRSFIYIAAGCVLGIILGVFAGEKIAGMMLGTLGASGFKFIINPVIAYILVPGIAFDIGLMAVRAGSSEVRSIELRM